MRTGTIVPRVLQPSPINKTEELSVATPSPSEGSEDESEQGGTRRWRGRRGRRRGVRGQQPQREGGAPTSSQQETTQEPAETFDIEAAPEVETYTPEPRRSYVPQTSAPAQAVFLPGESLSKYGMAPAVEPQIEIESLPSNPIEPFKATPAYTAFKPSTLIETPIVWDGGSLLPGETISRYRGEESSAKQKAAIETTSDPETVAAEAVEAEEAKAETEEQFEAAEQAEYEAAEEETSAIVGHAAEPTVEAEPVAEIEHIEASSERNVGPIAEEAEPHTASASYRVDPSAPSEYRVLRRWKKPRLKGISFMRQKKRRSSPWQKPRRKLLPSPRGACGSPSRRPRAWNLRAGGALVRCGGTPKPSC